MPVVLGWAGLSGLVDLLATLGTVLGRGPGLPGRKDALRHPDSRYRQWISHKLGTWHGQFGTSGCTGCGRCIAWCPAGIDITEEAARLAAADSQDRREDG